MKKNYFILPFLITCLQGFTQNPAYEWVGYFYAQGAGLISSTMQKVAIDPNNDVIVCGVLADSIDFDFSVGSSKLYNSINSPADGYIAKYNGSGNLLWAKQIGGPTFGHDINLRNMTTDNYGNIFICGEYRGIVDFDPDPNVVNNFNSPSAESAFILKLDPQGIFQWHKTIQKHTTSGLVTSIEASQIEISNTGAIYLGGIIRDTFDFDPGAGTYYLSSINVPSVLYHPDIFYLKLDAMGNFVWANTTLGKGNNNCIDICLDAHSNLISVGVFTDTCDFDPGSNANLLVASGGNSDLYTQKLDSNGNFMWAFKIGNNGTESPTQVKAGANNDIYLSANYFSTSLDIDPGIGSQLINTNNYSKGTFVEKLDMNGNFIWGKSYYGNQDSYSYGMDLDADNNIYITGVFEDSIDLNPDPTVYEYAISHGLEDCYNLKLDSNGNFVWGHNIGGLQDNIGFQIAVDNAKNVYHVGSFINSVDFNPDVNAVHYVNTTKSSLYLLKLSQCNSVNYTSVNACTSYLFNGNTIYNSGLYADTLQNGNGCDSLVYLSLTINQASQSTFTTSACKSYAFNNQNITASGNYFDTLVNAQGCDSIITLQLTINNLNTNVTQSGTNLTAVETAASYQWVSCPNYTVIPFATAQTFIPDANGSYAVIINKNFCQDTSTCFTVTGVGFGESLTENYIKVFPNPSYNVLHIESGTPIASIRLFNLMGQSVMDEVIGGTKNSIIHIEHIPIGVYNLELEAGGTIFRTKVAKQ